MPIFTTENNKASDTTKKDFKDEKELQGFIETNSEILFGVRFLVSEYTTSKAHGGRIDTLGIDENGSPVIIEYKHGSNDAIINQGLFYLDWLADHQADFKLIVQEKLGKSVDIDFGLPRLILVAKSFSKYDTYAINRMSENIELWSYSLYSENIFELKLVGISTPSNNSKNKISKVEYKQYSREDITSGKPDEIVNLFNAISEGILNLNSYISEVVRKYYIAYKTSHNIASIELQNKKILVFLPVVASDIECYGLKVRDVRNVGHFGTGDTEITITDLGEVPKLIELIETAVDLD